MKIKLAIICLLYAGSSYALNKTVAFDTLSASALHPSGRYAYNTDKHLELISSAANFGFKFKGRQCEIAAYITDTNGHNYLQYELDGVYQKRIKVEGNKKAPLIITAASSGTHTVRIYKATEAHTGPIFIENITGRKLRATKLSDAPLIEFIGNSITCGAASDASEVPCGTGVYHDQHNAFLAYGPRVARALKANFLLSSVSGIGIYRTWNTDGPSMPQVYEKTDFQDGSERQWDFTKYTPAVVSIALGTNDFSTGDGKHERLPFDSAVFVNAYIKFIQLVKSKYPRAQIALLSSPMVGGSSMIKFQNCLTAVKQRVDAMNASDKPVALYFFKPMNPKGCSWHPSVEDHAVLAEELTPFFKGLLK